MGYLSRLAAIALTICSITSAAQAATLQVNGSGQLTGATGVDVDGTSYDVSFVDGTCVDLFDGCDAASDFDFDNTGALAAAQALLDQVFLNTNGLVPFDTNPDFTNGCSDVLSCRVIIPFGPFGGSNVLAGMATNFLSTRNDTVSTNFSNTTGDTGVVGNLVWADFSISSVAPVPLPGAVWFLAAGLAGLGALRRIRA